MARDARQHAQAQQDARAHRQPSQRPAAEPRGLHQHQPERAVLALARHQVEGEREREQGQQVEQHERQVQRAGGQVHRVLQRVAREVREATLERHLIGGRQQVHLPHGERPQRSRRQQGLRLDERVAHRHRHRRALPGGHPRPLPLAQGLRLRRQAGAPLRLQRDLLLLVRAQVAGEPPAVVEAQRHQAEQERGGEGEHPVLAEQEPLVSKQGRVHLLFEPQTALRRAPARSANTMVHDNQSPSRSNPGTCEPSASEKRSCSRRSSGTSRHRDASAL
ncbi:hypothetical protein COSO111634_11140 [Corallococcus soli]